MVVVLPLPAGPVNNNSPDGCRSTTYSFDAGSMHVVVLDQYWGGADNWKMPRTNIEPFPYPRFKDGKDIGGVGYGYCLYVAKLSKEPELAFQLLDAMASQPNEFIKQGYHQPRKTLSNGKQALDPTLAKKYIPFYDQVFKGELSKTAVSIAMPACSMRARTWNL